MSYRQGESNVNVDSNDDGGRDEVQCNTCNKVLTK